MASVDGETEPLESNEEYQQNISNALSRLNEGSKYHSPSQDVDTFKKRISIRTGSVIASRKKRNEPPDPELVIRSEKIMEIVENERSYLSDLLVLQTVGKKNILFVFFFSFAF